MADEDEKKKPGLPALKDEETAPHDMTVEEAARLAKERQDKQRAEHAKSKDVKKPTMKGDTLVMPPMEVEGDSGWRTIKGMTRPKIGKVAPKKMEHLKKKINEPIKKAKTKKEDKGKK
jgi:hypothetical protein